MVPISQEVGHGTVKECFYHVLMNPTQDTRAWAEVWLSSCYRNVSVAAPGGRRRAHEEAIIPTLKATLSLLWISIKISEIWWRFGEHLVLRFRLLLLVEVGNISVLAGRYYVIGVLSPLMGSILPLQ